MRPKGKLLIIGGAEDKGEDEFLDKGRNFQRYEILKELLKASRNKKIEIITTASEVPEDVRLSYLRAFQKIHYPNPGFIPIRDRIETKSEEYIERVQEAGAIFFTGGDQARISKVFHGTKIHQIITDRYFKEKNFLIAGTSAGAMAMSLVMILGGGKEEALFNDDLKLGTGLGILEDCIIDTHFIKRGRFARLAHAIVLHHHKFGVGLGEDTALIIKNGIEAECRGSGMVVIIDGRGISKTNIKKVTDNEPIFVNNLKVHLLVKGCRFSLTKRKFFQFIKLKQTESKKREHYE